MHSVDRVPAHTHASLAHMIIINVHTIKPPLPVYDSGNYNYLGITIIIVVSEVTYRKIEPKCVIRSVESPNAGLFDKTDHCNWVCVCWFVYICVYVRMQLMSCVIVLTDGHAQRVHLIALASL